MPKTYNIAECAQFLHIHETTAQELAKLGELPGCQIGRAWVFLEDDLVAYLRDQVRTQQMQRLAEQEVSRGIDAATARIPPTPVPRPARKARAKRVYQPLPEVGSQVARA